MQHFSIVHRLGCGHTHKQTNIHPFMHPHTRQLTQIDLASQARGMHVRIYACAHNFKSLCVGLCRRALRARDYISYLRVTEDYDAEVTHTKNCSETKWRTFIEVSMRCSSFLTKHFWVKRHFSLEACISLVPGMPSV